MDSPARIALLIDADNARAARIDVILSELSAFGETSIRRAYGNWTKSGLKSWTAVLHDHGIRPVQQFDPSKGKNASDIALAVDAVEILHTQRPDAFALVSSDADFTPLVMHLREHGVAVYGFGDAKTPSPFQSACSRFLVLDRLAERTTDDGDVEASGDTAASDGADSAPLRVSPEQLRADDKLVSLLKRAVESAADESGWARVGTVGNHISNQSSFDPRNYGYAKLSRLLEASGLFDVRDEGLTTVAVRDRKLTAPRSSGRRAIRPAGAAEGSTGGASPAPATEEPTATAPARKAAGSSRKAAAPATTTTKRTSRGGRAR
ncbi:NYN domain-containing protein [Oryzobacter terrae]|uniref:NYN domain-containing protein n=1 Tax=Oryzobacter terrae TaxID=1620385 RepID=UPI00366D114F